MSIVRVRVIKKPYKGSIVEMLSCNLKKNATLVIRIKLIDELMDVAIPVLLRLCIVMEQRKNHKLLELAVMIEMLRQLTT